MWSFEKIEKEDAIGVAMTMHSPDGEENYPGEMTVGYDEGSFIVDESWIYIEWEQWIETGVYRFHNKANRG